LGIRVLSTGRSARVRLKTRPEHAQIEGVVHGGVIVTAADSAAAIAAQAAVGPSKLVTSVELKINFLGPVRDGTIEARAKVLHAGRRTVVCESEVFDGRRLAAKALLTYAVLDRPSVRPHRTP
jgi:acyl-CoA thioesterase